MPRNRERQRANRKLKRQMMAVSSMNASGYCDPTAGAAINAVMREGVKKNAKKG